MKTNNMKSSGKDCGHADRPSGGSLAEFAGNSRKSGVALIIVLGLLSALLLMGVAFSVQMRVERSGASSYRHGIQARHMIWSGLASAILDIDTMMTATNGDCIMYPTRDIMVSTGGIEKASVLTQTAFQFVPAYLTNAALAQMGNVTWHYVGSGDDKRGRYAFMIFNTSGLLDANRAGGMTRGGGTNCAELQLDQLFGVSATAFTNARAKDGRYETLPELIRVNDEVGDGTDFSTFSLAPVRERYDISGVISQKVYIGGDVGGWDKAKIVDALKKCGVVDAKTNAVYSNMVDYVDTDSIPSDLTGGCGEAVPMINEVLLEYQVTRDSGNNYTLEYSIDLEWYYPFIIGDNASYKVGCSVDFSANSGNTHAELIPPSFGKTNNINAGQVGAFSFGSFNLVSDSKSGSLSSPNPITVNFDMKLKAKVFDASGNVVDMVPAPYSGEGIKINMLVPGVMAGSMVYTQEWAECVDPRFNGANVGPDGRDWWVYSRDIRGAGLPSLVIGSTIGTVNNITKFYLANPAEYPANFDGDTSAYVGNHPFRSVGELGYVCMEPWTTIRLYDHGWTNMVQGGASYHKVLDFFTVQTNDYARGLVNINTTNIDVLTSVFYDMPEDEVKTNAPMSWDDAKKIATAICAQRPYTNMSELGKASIDWKNLITGTNEVRRESGIRNSCELLTTRQNLFTIIIRADSFSQAIGGARGEAQGAKGATLSSVRAVAEVWRDPIPDANGVNKTLVRYFRYLDD